MVPTKRRVTDRLEIGRILEAFAYALALQNRFEVDFGLNLKQEQTELKIMILEVLQSSIARNNTLIITISFFDQFGKGSEN